MDWEKHAHALALTLVVPANASKTIFPILMEPKNGDQSAIVLNKPFRIEPLPPSSFLSCHRPISTSRNSTGDSPIPKLDKFIATTLGQRGGARGRIRSWTMEYVSMKGKPNSCLLTYHMSGNRYCENISRSHKSNNIMWTVDLANKVCWQTCHDPDCLAVGFRGRQVLLPEEVIAEVEDYLLDQELAELDDSKIIPDTNSNRAVIDVNLNFNDYELDKELRELDTSLFIKSSGRTETKRVSPYFNP